MSVPTQMENDIDLSLGFDATSPFILSPDQAAFVAGGAIPVLLGVLECSADGSEVWHRSASAAVAAYFSVPPRFLRNRSAFGIGVSPAITQTWLRKLDQCLEMGHPVSWEYEHTPTRAGGARRFLKATVYRLPARGDFSKRFAYLLEDVSPRRAAEVELGESPHFLRKVAQTSPNIWYVYDLVEQRSIYANREISLLLGYTAAEIQAMEAELLPSLIHPDDLPATLIRFAAYPFQKDGTTAMSEFRARHKDGTYRDFLCHDVPFERDPETGLVRQMLGVVQDITPRRAVEDALALSEAQLRLAVEAANIGTLAADFAADAVALSPHARRYMGVAPECETIPVADLRGLVHEPDRASFDVAFARAVRAGGRFSVEYRVCGADGVLRWRSIEAQVLFDSATPAQPTQMIGVCLDIHIRKTEEGERAAHAAQQTHIAEMLQGSLLSVASPHAEVIGGSDFPAMRVAFPGFEVALLYEPALDEAQVGGDFYDAFALDEHRTAFVVGDVAGKGLDAAVSVAEVKFGLRSFLRGISSDPAEALAFLNARQIQAQTLDGRSRERLLALLIAVSDDRTGETRVAGAGAEMPLVCRGDGTAYAITDASGLPLGTLPDARYEARDVSLQTGDTLLLFTDGFAEAGEPTDAGATELWAAVAAACAQQAQPPFVSALVAALALPPAFDTTDSFRRDDICLLAARRVA